MKIAKKIVLLLMLVVFCGILGFSAYAENVTSSMDVDVLRSQFLKGVGPETQGYSIDYRYYSPVEENDSTKYPVFIWLHGLSDGEYEGKQLYNNNIAYWASDEFQARFKGAGGAFIIVPRSPEDKDEYWSDDLIYPLRASVDDFIAKNKANIDLSRIYIGGYSLGGRMTYKMAVAYPEMFAAIVPVCPAWSPEADAVEKLKDMPIWAVAGKTDPLVSYTRIVSVGWKNITKNSNCPEDCRLSTLSLTAYGDGSLNTNAHQVWYAVNNDMFSDSGSDYRYMKTVDGNGDKVTLTYPDGMISWLSGYESDFDGTAAVDSGNEQAKGEGRPVSISAIFAGWIRSLFVRLKNIFR